MNSFTIVCIGLLCLALDSFTALPLRQDTNVGEEIILSTIDTVESTSASSTAVTFSRTADTRTSTTVSPVSELLNAIFRQTIYTRIESLLLDPGRKSEEKQKIVDSAVSNYHRQKMFGSSTKKHSRNVRVMENTFEDLSFENWSFEESSFIKMTIRAPKRAQSMA